MKILLINSMGKYTHLHSEPHYAPLGLLYIASYLKNHGYEVSFIDPFPMRINNKN